MTGKDTESKLYVYANLFTKLFSLCLLQDIQQAIADKEPEVASCKEMGDNLKKYLVDDEKPRVDEALSELDDKWQSLRTAADQLAKNLFSTQARVDSFQHDVDELKTWLTATEETLDNLEPVGVEPEKVKEQLGAQAVGHFLLTTRLHLALSLAC